jgi:hypothetical protein
MPWKRIFQFADIETQEKGSQGRNGTRGDQKTAEQVSYSSRVSAQAKIVEPLSSYRSQERDQKQKGGNQYGSIKKTLKVCLRQKPQVHKMGDALTSPKKPRGEHCSQYDGSDQIGENLKTSAQEEKELTWTMIRRKLKFFLHAQ